MNKFLGIIILIPFLFGFLDSFTGNVNRGNELFEKAKYGEALKAYQDALIDDPQNNLISYNIGSALAALGKYEEAESELLKALGSGESELDAKAYYNLGNNYYRQGKLEEAVKMYEKALNLNPDDQDSKYNLELARKKIKEMLNNQDKRQQEQQQKSTSSSQEKQESGGQKKPPNGKDGETQKEDKAAAPHPDKKDESAEDEKDTTAQVQKASGSQPEEQEDKPAGSQPSEEMSKEDAIRILNALKQDEKDLMQNQNRARGGNASPEKDW